MFRLIKKKFIAILIGLFNGSNHRKCVSLSNQKCIIQPTLMNLHPNEYSHEFHYYHFSVKCIGSCNTLNDLSYKACISNETGDLILSFFNMITVIN